MPTKRIDTVLEHLRNYNGFAFTLFDASGAELDVECDGCGKDRWSLLYDTEKKCGFRCTGCGHTEHYDK